MSGWPNRILAVFSIIWGLFVVAVLIFNWLASNYMLSPEESWLDAIKVNSVILTIGVVVWYCFYRMMRWVEERN
jgi:hypothetical protein